MNDHTGGLGYIVIAIYDHDAMSKCVILAIYVHNDDLWTVLLVSLHLHDRPNWSIADINRNRTNILY